MLKRVLIIGRPNVGKSSLFNRLVQKRKALVLNQPGVTRDILKQAVSWWGTDFEIWDSGGLWSQSHPTIGNSSAALSRLIDQKVHQAIIESDLLLFVMDARTGCLDTDKKTFRMVKKSGKPFLTIVNKVDQWKKTDQLLAEFASLGVDLLPCAFESDKGVTEIVEWVSTHIRQNKQQSQKNSQPTDQTSPAQVKILTLGKPNVGKSLLCNALLKRNRMLTSSLKGTTVDIVEDQFQYRGFTYVLMDTAGFCRLESKNDIPITLAGLKLKQSLKIADLILLVVDATTDPSRSDARLLELCANEHKAVILVINKWDLANETKKEYRKKMQKKFIFHSNLPVVFTSALRKKGLGVLLKTVDQLYKKLCFRITTSELNHFLVAATRKTPSPVCGVQDVKFYYFTQTNHTPPHFIAFANYPKAVSPAYRRFLIRQIQNQWSLQGVPLKVSVRSRRETKQKFSK